MVVGMDFYKDSAQKNMSVAAFVASINGVQENKLNCTKYYSRCAMQQRGEEFSDNLHVFMRGNCSRFLLVLQLFFLSQFYNLICIFSRRTCQV